MESNYRMSFLWGGLTTVLPAICCRQICSRCHGQSEYILDFPYPFQWPHAVSCSAHLQSFVRQKIHIPKPYTEVDPGNILAPDTEWFGNIFIGPHFAVNMMMGIAAVLGLLRTMRQTCSPLIPGSIRSSSTRFAFLWIRAPSTPGRLWLLKIPLSPDYRPLDLRYLSHLQQLASCAVSFF